MARTRALDLDSSRRPLRPPGALAPRLGLRSRRSSRRRSRLGLRKFEKLYVAGADQLGQCLMGRRLRRRRGLPQILFLSEPRGRAEDDTPKTASKVHVELRRIKTSPTMGAGIITYIKSLYLHVERDPRLRGRARLVRKSVDSKVN